MSSYDGGLPNLYVVEHEHTARGQASFGTVHGGINSLLSLKPK